MEQVVRPHRSRVLALSLALVITSSVMMISAPSALAAGTLTNPSWSVSNNQASATSVNYAYSFKTATSGSIKTITFVVSGANLLGAPAVVVNYGISAGTVARAGQTITYTVTTPATIPINIPIFIELSGMTNPSPAGAFTTAITTKLNSGTTIDTVSPGPTVTFAAGDTAKTIVVAKSLTFTLDTPAFTLAMDPTLPALADQTQVITLTVATNANSGYTLTVSDLATHLQGAAAGNPTIAQVSAGKATSRTWPGAPNTGYTVAAGGGTPAIDPAFAGTKYAGYTSGGEQVASRANPTGGTADTIAITDRTAIDFSVPASTYTDTVTYTVAPNYT